MKEDRRRHAGWAVKSKSGHWLSYAHGFNLSDDAFFARIKETEADAKDLAEEAQEDFQGGFEYDIVEAWEPMCEQLRHQVLMLKQANTITPGVIFDMTMELEGILYKLRGGK